MARLPGNARNGQGTFVSYDRGGNYEYALIITHDWHHVVWQRDISTSGNAWVSHDITDTVMGLNDVTDSHNGSSIGVDVNGIVHVSGNTHDSIVRMVRTTAPHDISEWEEEPPIEKQAYYVTNLVENGVVEQNQDGWSSVYPTIATIDRVTHSYGWGSTDGNDTNCKATRLTRTAEAPSPYIGIGQANSITGNGFPVTAGEKYNASLSFRTNMVSAADITHVFQIVWRNGTTELSRTDSNYVNVASADRNKWYRPFVNEAIAPPSADNCIIVFATLRQSGNTVEGDAMWVDGLMLYEGEPVGDIVYRDGAFNGGTQWSGWSWNGTPYQSTSTGPIMTDGYAGINTSTYNRYQKFSDGTLLMSFAQLAYMKVPVGRSWSMWKIEPGDTVWQPIGVDGLLMKTVRNQQGQGVTYPVLQDMTANPEHDTTVADRAYCFFTHVDKNDILHIFAWFRMRNVLDPWGKGFYLRSHDKGETWETITGQAVTLPITPEKVYDETDAQVFVNDEQTQPSTGSSIAIDDNGRPWIAYRERKGASLTRFLLHYNGTEWVHEDLSAKYGFADNANLKFIKGDLWVWGSKDHDGKGLAVWGANHTQDTGLIVKAGPVNIGTPDGVYSFESGSQYEGAGTHSGGDGVYRISIPDNNSPRIFSFGDGVRSRV